MADGMPVAAGMDAMEESSPTSDPFGLSQTPQDVSMFTNMRGSVLPAIDMPDMADWDEDANGNDAMDYPMIVDIGTSVPKGLDSPGGAGEAAKGTPATASGGSVPSNMNPSPYE